MIAWAFLALLVLLAGGVGLAATVLPRRDWFAAELAGLAMPFGTLAVSASWFLLSFLLRDAALRWAVTVLCLGLFALGLRRVVSLQIRVCGEIGWALGAIWLVQFAVVTWQSLGCPLASDGLFIWSFRAKLAFLDGGQVAQPYFGMPWQELHPTYPLCYPLVQTWIFSWLGQTHQGAVKLVCPLFFASGVGLLWTAVRRATGNARTAALASTLLFFVPWAMFKPGGAASGWADFPLAVAYLAALTLALESALPTAPDPPPFRTHPLFWSLALLPWTKQEGIVLAGTIVGALALRSWLERCRDWGSVALRLALLTAAPVTVVLLWRWYLAVNGAAPNRDFLPVTMQAFADHYERLAPVGILLCRDLLNVERWGLLWPFALLALWDIQRRHPRESTILALAIFAPLAIYTGSYIFSAWPSVVRHANSSLTRLLIPLAMPALIAIGLALPAGAGGCRNRT